MNSPHDLHSFMIQVQKDIGDEYCRIRRRALEDPGTAGDEGEETWAEVLRQWLPQAYTVVTKGRIMSVTGEASGQIDILVLTPSYPKFLLNKKHYLAPGVAAAFECKLTLRRHHIISAVKNGAHLRRILKPEYDSYPPPVYGLLAHSHRWKSSKLRTTERIDNTRMEAEIEHASHPFELLDVLCLADLGTWTMLRFPLRSEGSELLTSSMGPSFHPVTDHYQSTEQPVGRFLTYLLRRLSGRTSDDLAALAKYFEDAGLEDFSTGSTRNWEKDDIPEHCSRVIH